ncbi:hypothetical protein PC116_g20881 [Phytophthora cactorum]|uniref:Uncharacterized protein n=1 Tax=Phytophthora cactorum TaxID=29920 RepID=A0A8T1GFB2_9STRA|nr:hypothetical protein PC112_g16850 [Phytophthora cactorum]KAG2810361.1 hypothetical protein PC111_g15689 [Phytophthora cactorum]KAG2850366.1 hypothetical protein PC113_g16848 [Phytophthora cactorum]KAG2888609.1 hypothetical protein PC114_g18346 [Phytophthora cactorum]KAG2900353.1 hypothetical protein PC115_g16233 [Phytophthora cactorum]
MATSDPEQQLSFRDCLPQVDAYLAGVVVAPTEPAILLDWNRDNVAHIVQAANAAGRPQDPQWLTRNGQGRITVNSFVNDIMRELKARALYAEWLSVLRP